MVLQAILFLIILAVLNYLFKFFYLRFRVYFMMRNLPGPPTHSFLRGNMARVQGSQEDVFTTGREWAKDYYPIYRTDIMFFSFSNIINPEDCELVMSDMKHSNKSIVYVVLADWLKNGLLTSAGKHWQHRRKILTPAFHFKILQEFISIFNDETEQFVQLLHKECHKPYIQINQYISQYTLKSIADTSMGIKLNFDQKETRDYKQAIIDLGAITVYRLMRSWLLFKPLYMFDKRFYSEQAIVKILHNFTRKVINKRKETFKVGEQNVDEFGRTKQKLTMLDLLLTAKADAAIDEAGIREEVDTFMFEGHDTTAVALQFTLMTLACHPEAQRQIYAEMEEIIGDVKQPPSFNHLQDMKYLERCLKEVLRLYPSVPFISRVIGSDLITSTGYLLPKGSETHIHIYDLHHNSDIYPDPEKFDPDRFLPEATQKRHPFAYVPFSAGPRNCIGQKYAMLELKSAVCGIVGNFLLEAVDTPETITLIADIVLRTKDDIKVRFIPRNK